LKIPKTLYPNKIAAEPTLKTGPPPTGNLKIGKADVARLLTLPPNKRKTKTGLRPTNAGIAAAQLFHLLQHQAKIHPYRPKQQPLGATQNLV